MQPSIISWTNVTWNPVHGCSRVSAGCKNCYAERLSRRYGYTQSPWTKRDEKRNVQLKPHKLKEPMRYKTPCRIFVNSMSDLFHEQIPDDYLYQIFDVMAQCPQHQFQALTKRPERAKQWSYWPDNVWLGATVENKKTLPRIQHLRCTGAKLKFISFEPLLEDLGIPDLTGIQWAIVGGESGPGYRPMDHEWARHIRDACRIYDVAFFFKQSSAYYTERGTELIEYDGSKTSYQELPR